MTITCLWLDVRVALLFEFKQHYSRAFFDRIVHVLENFMLESGLLRGGTCGWRSAIFGRELLEIDLGMWFG
jgi:hypothetical protein